VPLKNCFLTHSHKPRVGRGSVEFQNLEWGTPVQIMPLQNFSHIFFLHVEQ